MKTLLTTIALILVSVTSFETHAQNTVTINVDNNQMYEYGISITYRVVTPDSAYTYYPLMDPTIYPPMTPTIYSYLFNDTTIVKSLPIIPSLDLSHDTVYIIVTVIFNYADNENRVCDPIEKRLATFIGTQPYGEYSASVSYLDCSSTDVSDEPTIGRSDFIAYPNPTDEFLNILSETPYHYDLYDMSGRKMGETYSGHDVRIHLTVSPGFYSLIASDDHGKVVGTRRIVVQ